MESARRWITTLSLAALAVGVLLLGLRGGMPEARAESPALPPECKVPQGVGGLEKWMGEQVAAGRQRFFADEAIVCAW